MLVVNIKRSFFFYLVDIEVKKGPPASCIKRRGWVIDQVVVFHAIICFFKRCAWTTRNTATLTNENILRTSRAWRRGRTNWALEDRLQANPFSSKIGGCEVFLAMETVKKVESVTLYLTVRLDATAKRGQRRAFTKIKIKDRSVNP